MTTQFKIGDRVIDRDGYHGVVTRMTSWEGSVWYDVRILDGCRIIGEVVRYPGDLMVRS